MKLLETIVKLSNLPKNAVLLLMGDEDRPVALVPGEPGLRVVEGDVLVPLNLPEGFEPTLNITTKQEWREAVWNHWKPPAWAQKLLDSLNAGIASGKDPN